MTPRPFNEFLAGLDIRSRNCIRFFAVWDDSRCAFKDAPIDSWEKLTQLSQAEVLRMPNLGRISVANIFHRAWKCGVTLNWDIDKKLAARFPDWPGSLEADAMQVVLSAARARLNDMPAGELADILQKSITIIQNLNPR